MWGRIGRRRVVAVATLSLLATTALAFEGLPANALLGADVSIEASASPNPVEVDDELTLTLDVSNDGTANAQGVTVTDVLAGSLQLEDAISTLGSCSGTTTVVCSLGTMTPGQSATITLHLTPTIPGPLVNTATVVALLDTDPTDNAAVTPIDVVDGGGGGQGSRPTSGSAWGLRRIPERWVHRSPTPSRWRTWAPMQPPTSRSSTRSPRR